VARRLRLRIEGMTCTDCERHVVHALEGAGALQATANFRRGEAYLTAPEGVAVEALTGAVAAAGYAPVAVDAIAEEPAADTARPVRRRGGSGRVDLAILGSGGAAFAAAIRARDEGAQVVMCERGTIGGTCVNVGCVPSKTLLRAAEIRHAAGHHPFAGIATAAGPVDMGRLTAQKDELVAELRVHKYEDLIADYGWEVVRGEAVFVDPHTVEAGGRLIEADAFVVATGAHPTVPDIPGLAAAGYVTSTEVLRLDHVPKSVAVIGSGYIALELGQMLRRLGAAVTLMQRSPRLLKAYEPEVGEVMAGVLADEGIEVLTGVRYLGVDGGAGGRRVHLELGGTRRVVEAAEVLVATGRRPNTEALHAERAGVALGPVGEVKVDAELRSSVPHILAAGDVTAGPAFVYVAAYEGRIAAGNALGGHTPVDLGAVPAVTFTTPAIATVGWTEAAARAAGREVRTSVLPLAAVARAQVNRDTRGVFKLVADAGSGQILGAHVVAENAGEAIYAATLAVRFHLTISDLTDTLAPYLTMAEGIRLAAQTFSRDVQRLSCCAG
jgi:mercuric reductase